MKHQVGDIVAVMVSPNPADDEAIFEWDTGLTYFPVLTDLDGDNSHGIIINGVYTESPSDLLLVRLMSEGTRAEDNIWEIVNETESNS